MKDLTLPKRSFVICSYVGIGLLIVRWHIVGDTVGFFIALFLLCMTLLRWRMPNLAFTTAHDVMLCGLYLPIAMPLALFSAMYYRKYWVGVGILVLLLNIQTLQLSELALYFLISAIAGLAGFFLGQWEKEREQTNKVRDDSAVQFYELEDLQNDLKSATTQVERMTAVSERARIAREIHDNAGHEIVAAYMSLQTARAVLDGADPDALELYDAALMRLDAGANKIREAVHNLAPVTSLGVEALSSTCSRFYAAKVKFTSFGDTNHVPVHAWGVLEACLNETLTNAVRHAKAKTITVNLDTTPKLVRLCVENDAYNIKSSIGNGLRNLRYRAASVGGSIAIAPGDTFRVICVIPLRNEE